MLEQHLDRRNYSYWSNLNHRWNWAGFFRKGSGGVYEIVWLRLSDWRLQVCSIARSQPASTKVCQHVWRGPVVADLQVFSLMCVFRDRLGHCLEKAKDKKKTKNQKTKKHFFSACHFYVSSWMIYEKGAHESHVSAQGQIPNIYLPAHVLWPFARQETL